jgi:hypothetical protein
VGESVVFCRRRKEGGSGRKAFECAFSLVLTLVEKKFPIAGVIYAFSQLSTLFGILKKDMFES